MSKTALDRLGRRLAEGRPANDDDLRQFAIVAEAYQESLDQVERRLDELGYAATTRVKTTTTLIEKLQRESARLSQIHDLSGARLIVEDRWTQDDVVSRIKAEFDTAERVCKIIDRRELPSHGYRAVHLIVFHNAIPVEIQVRTSLQDTWAQIMERLADQWGRDIRYGGDPVNPDRIVSVSISETPLTRRAATQTLIGLSEGISSFEDLRVTFNRNEVFQRKVREIKLYIETNITTDDLLGSSVASGEHEVIRSLRNQLTELGRLSRMIVKVSPPAADSPVATLTAREVWEFLEEQSKAMAARSPDLVREIDKIEMDLRGILRSMAQAADEQE
jgi:prefoldin subunit 5